MKLGSRDRRALLVGLVVIGGGSTATIGVPKFKSWEADQRNKAATAAHDLALAAVGVKSFGAYRDSLAARQARLAVLDSTLLEGTTPAEAAAALSSTIADLADGAGVRVSSLQLRGDTTVSNGFSRVAVRVIGTTDVTGLATLVHDIEIGPTLLAIRELSVSQPEPGAAASRPEQLRVDLVAETLARVRKGVP